MNFWKESPEVPFNLGEGNNDREVKPVLVAQDFKLSSCTATLMDAHAMGQVDGNQNSDNNSNCC